MECSIEGGQPAAEHAVYNCANARAEDPSKPVIMMSYGNYSFNLVLPE